MKEHPILFNADMVKAILEGRKTQTRRVVKKQSIFENEDCKSHRITYFSKSWGCPCCGAGHILDTQCPFDKVGDRLWVRETWQAISPEYPPLPIEECDIIYKATDSHPGFDAYEYAIDMCLSDDYVERIGDITYPWKPSIHMPRWASRITLEITNIRVERLQDISEEDAIDEGIQEYEGIVDIKCYSGSPVEIHGIRYGKDCEHEDPINAFEELWDAIYKETEKSWDNEPWVWVVEFKKVESN